MPRTVQCTIVNDTEFELTATGGELNYQLQSGTLNGGATSPPYPIAAGASGAFTTTSDSTAMPAGWICYWLEPAQTVVQIIWHDAAAGDRGFKIGLNQVHVGTREVEIVDVAFADATGATSTWDRVRETDAFAAKFTVRLKPGARATTPANPVGQPVAATPDGQTPLNPSKSIPRWDSSEITQPRKRVLAAIGALFPMSVRMVGSPAPRGQGKYRKLEWDDTSTMTSCTSVSGTVMQTAKAKIVKAPGFAFDILNSPAWVPFAKGRLPNVGDMYMVYRDEDAKLGPHVAHVGFVVQVPSSTSEPWVTADGGQPDAKKGQCAILTPRPWKWDRPSATPSKPPHDFAIPIAGLDYPYVGGGEETGGMSDTGRWFGWLDIDHPAVTFEHGAALDPEGSDKMRPALVVHCMGSDLVVLGTRIQSVIDKKDSY